MAHGMYFVLDIIQKKQNHVKYMQSRIDFYYIVLRILGSRPFLCSILHFLDQPHPVASGLQAGQQTFGCKIKNKKLFNVNLDLLCVF